VCGIAGYIGKSPIQKKQILDTISVMKNRGPDHQDYISFSNGEFFVTLIHSRLSIIDLDSRSNQPFFDEHCILVFNGEIYNYLEIRKELENLGAIFKTSSDTEVLIKAYLHFGEECVNKFEGMWSFALFDKIENKLFLSRDRFAEKPLYYFESNQGIYFSSEIKAIKQLSGNKLSVNNNHLYRYLINGHKSLYKTDQTFYKGIKELDFASNLIISNNDVKNYKYWKPVYCPKKISESDAIEGIKYFLKRSLRLRLRSDVPLAFCLSGGVDSASLVSLAAKELNYDVSTFSIIDSDVRYNELENIHSTVNDVGCNNYKIFLEPEANNLNRLKNLINYHDSPIATISYFIHSMISEEIANQGFKISISGTGADELFTGYYDHFNLHMFELKDELDFPSYLKDWENHVLTYIRNPMLKKHDLYFENPNYRDHIYFNNDYFSNYLKVNFKEEFKEKKYSNSLLRNRLMNELFHEVVRVILHEDDLNSMYYSIENRSPFLDKDLFNFMYSVPNKLLIKNGYAKYLLRKSLKGVLNEKVRKDREKRGFNASINSIINFDKKEHIEFLLDDSKVFDIVDKSMVESLLKKQEFSNSFKKFIFCFINVKMFLEN